MKRSFFQAAFVSILIYGNPTWILTKRMEKRLDGNYTRMRAILKKSLRQHPIKWQVYGHLSTITKTIQVRRTRHAWLSRKSKDELISDILLWIPSHGRRKAERPAWTYIQYIYIYIYIFIYILKLLNVSEYLISYLAWNINKNHTLFPKYKHLFYYWRLWSEELNINTIQLVRI